MYMTDKQQKLIELRDKLYNGDAMRRSVACDEIWQLIETVKEDQESVELMLSEMMDVLADLDREEDWKRCYETLYASKDYRLQVRALGVKAWKLRKLNPPEMQSIQAVYEEAIEICTVHNDSERAAEFCMMLAKIWLSISAKRKDALDMFGQCMTYAQEAHNHSMEAVVTYYIGVLLHEFGYVNAGLEKLRTALEMAYEQHDKRVAMHIEAVRAH